MAHGLNKVNTGGKSVEEQILSRLNKMESKIDDLGRAMIQLARTEERVSIVLEQNAVLFKQSSNLREQSDLLKDRIHKIETDNATQGQSLGFFERVGWIVITGLVSLISLVFK